MACRQEMEVVTNAVIPSLPAAGARSEVSSTETSGVIPSEARNLSSLYGTAAKMHLRGSRKNLHGSILLITDC
jgi:hypothetical protein